MKRKITEISIFEFFMCMFVITIHLMSDGIDNFTKWSVSSIVFMSVTRLITFAVPGFVFTSAIKMFYNYGSKKFNYPKFLWGRFLKVYIPYIIAVVIYYLVFVYILKLDGYEYFDIRQLINCILTGDISAQFYFVILIVQFYLLMPLWMLLGKIKSPSIGGVLILAALVITILSRMYFTQWASSVIGTISQWNIPFNPVRGIDVSKMIPQLTASTNKSFTSYLVFWVCGMYIGLNYEKFNETVHAAKPVIYIGWLALAVSHCILSYMKFCKSIQYNAEPVIVVMFCLFSIFGFYIYIDNLTKSLEKSGKGFLSSIADSSYDIYLIHCLVITIVSYYLINSGVNNVMLRFVITASITYVFSILFCVIEGTIQTNIRLKYRRKSAAKARKAARRKRYL